MRSLRTFPAWVKSWPSAWWWNSKTSSTTLPSRLRSPPRRVLRLTTVSLSEGIVTAVNAAFEDLQKQLRDAMVAPDLDGLANQLKEVQEESNRQMGTFLQALTDAQERIASQGRS